MALIIDSHVHVLPNPLANILPETPKALIGALRERARGWLKPVSRAMHQTQPYLRYLPESARKGLEEFSGLAPFPGLLLECTADDLKAAMAEAGVDRAMVIAHYPAIPNELVLELAESDSAFVPVVTIPQDSTRPATLLRSYAKKGAKALKIHPAADGEGLDSNRYKSLLKSANELHLPVIVHTGCFHSRLLYKNPELGHAEIFEPWFSAYPEVKFILAHMNFHEPDKAMDLAEKHANVHLETSWQPAEIIGEAVRRVGAERVLFGTDWPFIGDNLSVGIRRVHDCVEAGMVTEEQSTLILGQNATRIFGI